MKRCFELYSQNYLSNWTNWINFVTAHEDFVFESKGWVLQVKIVEIHEAKKRKQEEVVSSSTPGKMKKNTIWS